MTLSSLPLLSMLIWTPILGGIWVLIAGDRQEETVKYFSFAVSIITFVFSVILYCQFDTTYAGMQFVEETSWITAFDIKYHLGVDGIALPLILLTTFTTILVILASWEVIQDRISYYMCAFLILTGLMNAVFVALDAILFYVFWEAMLIPMFLIIGIWGGPNRVYATIKFFLYTFLGSVFMLVAFLYLYSVAGSFNIEALHDVPLGSTAQKLIFIAFFLAFAVKIPMWPVHTWLPDAHVEAPTAGSVVLAAVMLKMGGYGFLRFSLPITPDASLFFSDAMIALSLIAIVYIGFVALVQEDMKKLIAYSIGNFIFDQYFHTPPVSFILYVWMDDDKFHRAELVPIYIKGYVPAPATGIQRTTLNKRVKTLSNRRELSLSSSGGHLVIGNKTLEDVTMEVELKFTDSIRVRDLYKFPVTGQLTSVVSNKPTVNYRLGENQINGGDFESFNLFSSKERGWLLENAKLSSLKASSGSNSVELNLKQGKTTLVGMKYFRRVFSAGNPMTYKARILTTSHPIKLRLLIQRRKKRDKLFDALEGNKKELLKEIVIASNKSWQDIEIDFNTPRVGYRSYRILLEISHVNKDANVDRIDDKPVFIDDIALVKWQGYYNESGKLPYDHSILGLATHLGIEKIDTDVNLKLKFN